MTPQTIVSHMMHRDYFSQWLGIEVLEVREGYCKLRMVCRHEMLNGFGIVHGGVTFSLADSAFAFASNSYGQLSVSLNATATYPKSAKEGDVLVAEATELTLSNKVATYDIVVKIEGSEEVVMLFRGTVFRTGRDVVG